MSCYEPNKFYVAVAPAGEELDYHIIEIPYATLKEARKHLREEVQAENDFQMENYGGTIDLDTGILKTDDYGNFVKEYH